jgi:hypothetical protein
MVDTEIDGAELWFPPEVDLVETITFIDRRFLGVVTRRTSGNVVYASLMRKAQRTDGGRVTWEPHTLWEAMTDTVPHARDVVLAAYEALDDRLANE